MRRPVLLAPVRSYRKSAAGHGRHQTAAWSEPLVNDVALSAVVIVIPRVRDSLVLRRVAKKKSRQRKQPDEQRAR